jgi:hypothetical protein
MINSIKFISCTFQSFIKKNNLQLFAFKMIELNSTAFKNRVQMIKIEIQSLYFLYALNV